MVRSTPQGDTGAPSTTEENICVLEKDAPWKPAARVVWGWVNAVRQATLEPVMLLDGACNQAMLIFSENIQLSKICSVKLGLPEEVCGNMTAYEQETILAQQAFTKFSVYNAILMSLVPAFMGIFLGAWSDKYGRKVPLLITLTAHACYAGGYLLYNHMTTWPVEVLFLVTFLEALGGGNACFLAMGTCYTSDLSSLKSHTSRVSTNNSLWYLGGPIGTLLCGFFIATGNDNSGLLLLMITYVGAILYVCFCIEETHGPFMHESFKTKNCHDSVEVLKKEDITTWQMLKDFFRPKHLVDVYRTALKRRDGNTRVVIIAVIVANMIRRVARGFFMYMFVRRVLLWEGDDYSFWMSYRTLVAALGSLSLVPTLSNLLNFSDLALVLLGTISIMLEYLCYGLVTSGRGYLLWVGPPLGLLANANIIALRSSATKLVNKQEKGHVTAVMASLNGLMPLVAYGVYQGVYSNTVVDFPSAQFFFASALNVLIIVPFAIIMLTGPKNTANNRTVSEHNGTVSEHNGADLEHNGQDVTVEVLEDSDKQVLTVNGPEGHSRCTENGNVKHRVRCPPSNWSGIEHGTVISSLGATRSIDVSSLGATRSIDVSSLGATRSIDVSSLGATRSIDVSSLGATRSIDASSLGATRSIDASSLGATRSIDVSSLGATRSIDASSLGATRSIDVSSLGATRSIDASSLGATRSIDASSLGATRSIDVSSLGATRSIDVSSLGATRSIDASSLGATRRTTDQVRGCGDGRRLACYSNPDINAHIPETG